VSTANLNVIRSTNVDRVHWQRERDKQTDRQNNQRFWLFRRRVKSTKLCLVIEDLKHVLAPLKHLGV